MQGLAKFVYFVDALNEKIGRGVAWLTLAMVLVTFVVVILRYVYAIGWVWLQESYVWMHGIVFMVGAGYTLLHNGHVRVDILYRPAGPRYKAVIDLFGSAFLLLPLLVIVFLSADGYVIESWARLEESREAGGLPGLFILKSFILAFAVMLGLQGLSLAARSLLIISGSKEFEVKEDGEVL